MSDLKKYRQMLCPVCEKFYFSEPQEGDEEFDFFNRCDSCGWICDYEQTDNPDLRNGKNEMSLNEYKKWYREKIKENSNFNYGEEHCSQPIPHKCPICGKYEFVDYNSFEICPHCGWEDDEVMTNHPTCVGGANDLSLLDYKKQYENMLKINPSYNWRRFDRLKK